MKSDEIQIQVSPITNTIYAGRISNSGKYPVWTQKKDVTEQTLSAVAQYMDGHYTHIDFPSGSLIWEPRK